MEFNNIMHIALFTKQFDEMVNFYTKKMGFKVKAIVRYKEYLHRDDRKTMQNIAKNDPERIFNMYIEVTPGQFIELFHATENQKPHTGWNEHMGYSHFALTVNDINQTYKDFIDAEIIPDTKLSKGPSGTWQFWAHDPDGNKFEIMQYTEESYQVVGHLD